MAAAGLSRKRLLIVGLPRSGTTLMATLLGAQPNVHFLTDYFPAFTEVMGKLGRRWHDPLSPGERRIALAVVRDQFLRVRHPVLVKQDGFGNLDELHRAVLAELAAETDELIGHKLLLTPLQLGMTLEHTGVYCLLMYRDPRDAALSFFHRTGGGVETYLRNWRGMLRLWRRVSPHPRLLALKFEDLLEAPERTLATLGSWLGLELSGGATELRFQRSRTHGATPWRHNSAFGDVAVRFDAKPIGRWRSELGSPIVRYAGWFAARELPALGYEPSVPLRAAERVRYACLSALDRSERDLLARLTRGAELLRKALWRRP